MRDLLGCQACEIGRDIDKYARNLTLQSNINAATAPAFWPSLARGLLSVFPQGSPRRSPSSGNTRACVIKRFNQAFSRATLRSHGFTVGIAAGCACQHDAQFGPWCCLACANFKGGHQTFTTPCYMPQNAKMLPAGETCKQMQSCNRTQMRLNSPTRMSTCHSCQHVPCLRKARGGCAPSAKKRLRSARFMRHECRMAQVSTPRSDRFDLSD